MLGTKPKKKVIKFFWRSVLMVDCVDHYLQFCRDLHGVTDFACVMTL